MVSCSDLVACLQDMELSDGDTLLVHSSLSSFGHVEGGPCTVITALLSVIGEQGTLIMPAFSRYLLCGEDSWDRENTPSLMGAISETFRTWPGVIRSSHAAHSLASIGRHAELICRRPHRTGFGADSPFHTFLTINGKVLLMGVSWQSCTFFHLLEAMADVPYRYLEERRARITINGNTKAGSAWEYTRKEGYENDFGRLGRLLEDRGLVRIRVVGQSTLRLFEARDAYRVGMEELRKDPRFLLVQDEPHTRR